MSSSTGTTYAATTRLATNANLDIREFGTPKKIIVNNLTNSYRAEWNNMMADAAAIVTAQNGDRSVVAAAGFTPLAGSSTQPPGIRLGALANINDTAGESLLFEFYY